MRISFPQIRQRQRRTGKCAVCGKKTTQTLSVEQTVNPLNKDAGGRPKTETAIRKELAAELRAMLERPLHCPEHRQ